MTTSSNTTKREKVTLKKSEVVPSNFHLEEKHYAPMVVIDGETTFGAWCNTKEEEGVYPERSRIMEELYNKSGRTNSIFTGLADEYVTVSNNNPQ